MIAVIKSYLNGVDYVIIGIIGVSVLISFFRGFVREAISLTVWAAAILVAFKFANPVQLYLAQWMTFSAMRYAIAFAGLFLSVLIGGILLNAFVHLLMNQAGLNITDRLLGIIFGAFRGVVLVTLILMFMSFDSTYETQFLAQSQLASTFKPMVGWMQGFLPNQMKQVTQWLEANKEVDKTKANDEKKEKALT